MADSQNSVLVVIDVQQKLSNAMPETRREQVLKQTGVLLTAAGKLSVPVLITEQYPKGLGATEAALLEKIPAETPIIDKTAFSAARVAAFDSALKATRRQQVILTGMEAHICVLQTALDLLKQGYQVQIVADAVCSRTIENHDNALQRLRNVGAVITNTESVLFEWLGDAAHPDFRELSKLIV